MSSLLCGLLAWPVKHTDHSHAPAAPRFLTAGTPVSVLRLVAPGSVLVQVAGVTYRVPVGFVQGTEEQR